METFAEPVDVKEVIVQSSWRVKAGLVALVSAKINGLAAAIATVGVISGNPHIRHTAVYLICAHALSVVAALVFAGWEYLAQNQPKRKCTCGLTAERDSLLEG
jgi:hypothetical protein